MPPPRTIRKRPQKRDKASAPSEPSHFQNTCASILVHLALEEYAHAIELFSDLIQNRRNIEDIACQMMHCADFKIITYLNGVDGDTISFTASYKNYTGPIIGWPQRSTDNPVVRYKHPKFWVGVIYCILTLSIRLDKPLWIREITEAPQKSSPASPPKLKRIKRVGTRR